MYGMRSVTYVRAVQFENACDPISFTLSGMTILSREVQFLKANFSIAVTRSGITILLRA